MALESIEGPILGPRRDDLRAGVIASTIANANRGKGDKAVGPEDYVLKFSEPGERMEEQVQMLRRAAKAKT